MIPQTKKTALIIGAGPAGLTAALELLKQSDIQPIILEASEMVGGIARTEKYKGNSIDIGGHRFFSKSDRVMNWWLELLPLESPPTEEVALTYQGKTTTIRPGPPSDRPPPPGAMLVRERLSRIYFLRKFFDYPISLTPQTVSNLGLLRTARVGLSYARARLLPRTPESTLEDFLINRFGQELYETFFKAYTEKVWGVACSKIDSEWGAQRIKGLNVATAVAHFAKKLIGGKSRDVRQKSSETSLIERFLYPKLGPGQLWEEAARQITIRGGEIRHGIQVDGLRTQGTRIVSVLAKTTKGDPLELAADYVVSTMPLRELVRGLTPSPPKNVQEVAEGLIYRDFLTVGLLVKDLKIRSSAGDQAKDNWIYIQEPEVKVGRLQLFHNWSPYLVADPQKKWIGLEYFCNEGDDLWSLTDEQLKALAEKELVDIDILDSGVVLDSVVIRVPKTYPAYFGSYDRFNEIRSFLDTFENLFLVGRNGMHRYNNQDHSMLTAMAAVENMIVGRTDKENIWSVNADGDYHEEK